MKLNEICEALETWAPLSYQESYDNSCLIYGDKAAKVDKVLIALDTTEAVVDEAIAKGAQMIISHHPLVFQGIKALSPKTDAERALIKAIKHEVAIYALHTNLDNISSGVNAEIGRRLGIDDPRILAPKKGLLQKLIVYVPQSDWQKVAEAMWQAGAGSIGEYDQCSYRSPGKGTFRPSDNAKPHVGLKDELHEEEEYRMEIILEIDKRSKILKAMKESHPYEEVAYDLIALENSHQQIGSGMFGDLPEKIASSDFLKRIKENFGGVVRHTKILQKEVSRIAWCGGSGSFLLNQAKAVGADLFLSSDFKYHQFFEAENEILIADIGHYENEQFTIDLIAEHLQKKFPTFAVLLTENSTNPINYI